jgi:hypothetical protein
MTERRPPAAHELINLAAVNERDTGLDIVCETGNAALTAVRGADKLVGVDFEPRVARDRGDGRRVIGRIDRSGLHRCALARAA